MDENGNDRNEKLVKVCLHRQDNEKQKKAEGKRKKEIKYKTIK